MYARLALGFTLGLSMCIPLLHIYYGPVAHQKRQQEKVDSFSTLASAYVAYGKYFFFRSNNTRLAQLSDADGVDICLGILSFLMILFRQAFAFALDGLMVIVSMTLWIAVIRFQKLVSDDIASARVWRFQMWNNSGEWLKKTC